MSEEFNRLALKQKQSLPLEGKIILAQRRIREWYDHWDGQVYVSFSGGKDSTVLLHLVREIYPDVPAVFVDTGLEYPEIRKFAMSQDNVTVIRPEMRFDEVIKKYGYPVFSKEVALYIEYGRKAMTRGDEEKVQRYLYGIRKNPKTGEKYKHMALSKTALDFALNSGIPASNKCCSIMKKKPVKKYARETGRKSIQGTMAAESKLRENAWLANGCNAFDSKEPVSRPLSIWTEQDILHYIAKYNIPYCCVYGDIVIDEARIEDALEGQINAIDYLGCYEPEDKLKTTGCDRTGCMFCMFGCHLEKKPNRFQRMKETHPRQYDYCMRPLEEKGLGLREVLEYIGVDYE